MLPDGEGMDIAAVNAPTSVVVSGTDAAVAALAERMRADGRRVHQLAVSHAFHSGLMEPILGEFAATAARITVGTANIPVVSNVTGGLAAEDFGSTAYWVRHIREAVRFADSVRTLDTAGVTRFLELGPSSGLTASIEQTLPDSDVLSVPLLRKESDEPTALSTALARLFVSGVGVRWPGLCGGGVLVPLADVCLPAAPLLAVRATARVRIPPRWDWRVRTTRCLGAVVASADGSQVVLTGRLAPSSQGWLNDHAVGGVVLFAGAGFVELAIRAGDEVGCGSVDELNLHAPLMLTPAGADVQVIVGPGDDTGKRAVSVFSCPGEGADWTLHAEGVLSATTPAAPADLSVWPPAGATPVDVADAYGLLNGRGYQYGPAFQGLRTMWRRGDEIFAEVAVPEAGGSVGGFGVHPALLDSALHAVVLAAGDDDQIALPFSWQGVTLARCRCRGGAGADRTDGPALDEHRAGRRVGAAGVVGVLDGGPPDQRRAARCRPRRRSRWPRRVVRPVLDGRRPPPPTPPR